MPSSLPRPCDPMFRPGQRQASSLSFGLELFPLALIEAHIHRGACRRCLPNHHLGIHEQIECRRVHTEAHTHRGACRQRLLNHHLGIHEQIECRRVPIEAEVIVLYFLHIPENIGLLLEGKGFYLVGHQNVERRVEPFRGSAEFLGRTHDCLQVGFCIRQQADKFIDHSLELGGPRRLLDLLGLDLRQRCKCNRAVLDLDLRFRGRIELLRALPGKIGAFLSCCFLSWCVRRQLFLLVFSRILDMALPNRNSTHQLIARSSPAPCAVQHTPFVPHGFIVRCMMRFCATHDEALSFAVASAGKMA